LDSVIKRGVCEEAYFRYGTAFVAKTGDEWKARCVVDPARDAHTVKISSSDWFKKDYSRKGHLAYEGPLTACFDVYEDFYSYGDGVYHQVSGSKVGSHCVLVIGYSDNDNCWICKNSWGTGWGEKGYFRIGYGECNIDSDSSPFHSAKGVLLSLLSCAGSVDDNCTARLLAVDNGTLYWVDPNTTVLNHGRIVNGKLSCAGSVDDNCTARLLAVDNGTFYWVDPNTTVLFHGTVR
jgi:hypothetical protein